MPNKINITVLVAPLDWGLGHATRCIPLIRYLRQKNYTVLLAASGMQEILLRQEFPDLEILPLEGYGIRYAKKNLMGHLFGQVGRIYSSIQKEHRWLKTVCENRKINWIISDNRYGLWHPNITSTFMTHQLRVKLPSGMGFAEKWVQRFIYRNINKFSQCWIPDEAFEPHQLSGELGHPSFLPKIPVHYIGWQSRFSYKGLEKTIRYRCILLLSGPEPQRSMLETILVDSLKNITSEMILVRGLPGFKGPPLVLPPNIQVFNHLSARELERVFSESEFLLARSGYSTLMDAFTLQKKCILIPTPGQTEQEYLANQLQKQGAALVYPQSQFNLGDALHEAESFPFNLPKPGTSNLLEKAVIALESVLKNKP